MKTFSSSELKAVPPLKLVFNAKLGPRENGAKITVTLHGTSGVKQLQGALPPENPLLFSSWQGRPWGRQDP